MGVRQHLRPALVILLALSLITGLLYPLAVTALAQLLFPTQAEGSLVRGPDGQVLGSSLISQTFRDPRYFHPRPSAANYDPQASGPTNAAPSDERFHQTVAERARAYREENGLDPTAPVPVDAVTASGSGLDPEISLANALLQVPRVARARGLPEERVRRLVEQAAKRPWLGLFGEPRVNVLELNLALDADSGQ